MIHNPNGPHGRVWSFTFRCGRMYAAVGQDQEAVVTHGDFHMGNIAFTSHNSAVTFFDLQVSRQNSGVTDLVQYLVQVGV